jgi:diguanylate cyclase (GGDEF)-like protein
MRLATITNWAYGITVALTLASGAAMLLASSAQERERAAATERHVLDRATSTIDEDVATLSGLARQYAISASTADLTAYQREARLLGAVEARTSHIRDAGAGPDELQMLHETLRWADALQEEQRVAIAARQRGDRETALGILFSPEYERELDRIQTSVDRFRDRIDQRTDAALQGAIGASKLWRSASETVLAITGLLVLFVLYFVFRRRVLHPVIRLSDVVTRLAAQDYAAVPPTYGQVDEIGDMSHALRIFRENGLERQRLEQERDADRAVRDLLSRMTQRMQSCDTTDDLRNVVQRFVPEIAPQFAGRLYLFDEHRNAMAEACSWLDPVHSRTEFPPLACWGLRRGISHRPAGNRVDVPCDHVHFEGMAMPDSICMPLAAQHGTLGMLYFERRPDADADALPEVYLKTLAENIGLALDNLRLRDALRGQAMADPLTSLANRRHLEAVLETELAQAERHGVPISCVMLDIDYFKHFNDEYGHDAGDAVLRAVAIVLKQSVREHDLAFRYGGEEFLLLMPGVDADAAAERAEDIRSQIAALRVRNDGRSLGMVMASLGVATVPDHASSDRLVQTADAALLRAKRNGRNQVSVAQTRRPVDVKVD